jgi:hypothetical protein
LIGVQKEVFVTSGLPNPVFGKALDNVSAIFDPVVHTAVHQHARDIFGIKAEHTVALNSDVCADIEHGVSGNRFDDSLV